MAKVRFTKTLLSNLSFPPQGKRITLYDDLSRGLCLIVSPGGAKSFYVLRKVKGRTERILLGRFPDTTLEQARKRAGEVNSKIDAGINPNDVRRKNRQEPTLDEIFEVYMARHIEPHRKRPDDIRAIYRYLASLGKRKITDITPQDIRKLYARLGSSSGKATANKVHDLIRAIYNKAIHWELFEGINPAIRVDRFAMKSRERFLMPDELPAFFKALRAEPNETIRDFILVLLFTGARRREAQGMKWADIDFSHSIWTIPVTKNGEPRIVPLVAQVMDILEKRKHEASSEYVFPGSGRSGHLEEPKGAWKKILERAGIQDLRIHDLRRTFGSWMTIKGANMQIVGKALGHKDINSTAIYARLHIEPVRTMANSAVSSLLEHAEGSK